MDVAELDDLAAYLMEAATPVPGDVLARRLGLEPSALPSRLSALKALGVPISEDGHGLRLICTDALDARAVGSGLSDLDHPPVVEVCRVCESTNARVGGGPGPRLCLAEVQTAGRGRRGHVWLQPFGTGLALSYGTGLHVERVDGLAIAMAVAVAEALAVSGFEGIGLKWPNDLYARGGKLGGVMVEAAGAPDPRLVIGVGLNVHAAPVLDGRAATALADLAPAPSRNVLAVALARGMAAALTRFQGEGFAPFAEAFARLDVLAGQPVFLAAAGNTISGVACGIGPLGEIVLETTDGVHRYTAGEVSLGHV